MESLSLDTVKKTLKRLMKMYMTEATEGDECDALYWESAQDTIRDVAAALNISLGELQGVSGR